MINHAFSVLYGTPGTSPSGLASGLTANLLLPETVSLALDQIRGVTAADREAFALHGLRILDASSFRSTLWNFDARTTIAPYGNVSLGTNVQPVIAKIVSAPPALIQYVVVVDEDHARGYHSATFGPERAAAVLSGLITRVTVEAGL